MHKILPINFDNPIEACFSNDKCILFQFNQATQIEDSFDKISKAIDVQNQLRIRCGITLVCNKSL